MHLFLCSLLRHGRTLVVPLAAFFLLAIVLTKPGLADETVPSRQDEPAEVSGAGQTATPKEWDIKAGAGAKVGPRYEGSKNYTVSPLPYFDINWRDTVSLNPKGVDVTFLNDPSYKIGMGLTYNLGRDARGNSFFGTGLSGTDDRLRHLGTIDPAVGVRAFASYTISPFVFRASVTKFTGADNDGVLVNGGVSVPYKVMDNLVVRPSVTTTWADDKYMQSFFGVDGHQWASSGLSVFHARYGFKDVGADLGATYQFTEHWFASADAGVKLLLGDAAKSPITESSTSATFSSMVGYHF